MYFSMLPLLLLLASTVWASPVHIERRFLVDGAQLPDNLEDKRLSQDWNSIYRSSAKVVEGVPVAMKVTLHSLPYLIVKVEVMDKDVKTVTQMIDNLGHVLKFWHWENIDGGVAFTLRMEPRGEQIVKNRLRHLPEINPGALARMSLGS